MEKAKYIVFTDGSCRIFSTNNIHAYMTGGKEAKSAGFVGIVAGELTGVYGQSTTLGVKSEPSDIDILLKCFNIEQYEKENNILSV